MSKTYVPLYRKYRPQMFADLIGQENITQALSNAIKLNKVAHAYLFCGPRGTGKTSSARILAKSLNCLNGPTIEPCGTCPSCVDITNSTPVDVIEIDAASNRSVEDAQNILEKIQYVPIHGKYKIYIIDEVHMLSATAFNALLKTLEEPPENVVFILATTEAHKVLETIVSRCQRFDFRRITVDDIVKRLEFISEKENINISKDALYAIAKSVQGGMRDALALLDQLSILDVQKQIDVQDVENLLGKISVDILFDLTEKILSNSPQDAVLTINKIYAKGNEPLQILSNLIEYFRNLLIIKTCKEREIIIELTKLNNDLLEKILPQAQRFDITAINYAIDKLAVFLREIRNATDRYLWLEVCVIELTNKLSSVSYSDLVKRIEELEKAISGGVQFAPKPIQASILREPVKVLKEEISVSQTEEVVVVQEQKVEQAIVEEEKVAEIVVSPQEEISKEAVVPSVVNDSENGLELWQSLLSKFTSLPSKMFFANLSCPVMITPNKVIIGFTKEVFVTQSRDTARMTPLKAAVSELFGNSDMPIETTLISESEAESFRNSSKKKVSVNNIAPSVVDVPKINEMTSEKFVDEEDEQSVYYEKQLEKKQDDIKTPKNHSDQAKMILELFNGKYLD